MNGDTKKLSMVIRNVHTAIVKATSPNNGREDAAVIEATGYIVAALIIKEKTIYHDN